MEIEKQTNGLILSVKPVGNIDTITAVEFGESVFDDLDEKIKLILDFSAVGYISSMGLRILLELQKRMKEQGEMVLQNVNESVMEVFKISGFDKILTIV